MIGIVYKFTILLNKRFYVGQHIDFSVEHFLQSNQTPNCYWGSGGRIWTDNLNWLKNKFPNHWHKLIKREVLCYVKEDNLHLLNKLERYWIKKTRAQYFHGVGGCNYLEGEPNGDDWVNAMKDPEIRKRAAVKIGKKTRERLQNPQNHPMYGKHHSEETRQKQRQAALGRIMSCETRKKMGDKKKNVPKSIEHRRKISMAQKGEKSVHYGTHLTNEHKKKVSEQLRKFYQTNDSALKGRIWITNGEKDTQIKKTDIIPEGWCRGRRS